MDMVCMTRGEFEQLRQSRRQLQQRQTSCRNRDIRVLEDPLFPPLNRSTCSSHLPMMSAIANRDMYVRTQPHSDEYRLLGYLVNNSANSDIGGNRWKLFGNEASRHSHRFFMVPVNTQYQVKVPITENILSMSSPKLRNVYDLPQSLIFKTPLLNESPYELTELPRGDLTLDGMYA